MTNREQILQVIDFFNGKELVFKKEFYATATIRAVHTDFEPGRIRVILRLSDYATWHIDIIESIKFVNWLWATESITHDWDLILNGISFKKCIKEGLSCLTLYDIVQ